MPMDVDLNGRHTIVLYHIYKKLHRVRNRDSEDMGKTAARLNELFLLFGIKLHKHG